MKKITTILMLIALLLQLTACANKIGPATGSNTAETIENNPPLNVPVNDPSNLKVDGFENAQSFNATFSGFNGGAIAEFDYEHPYYVFERANYFQYPYYINENAKRERTLSIGDRTYKFSYEYTVINSSTIVDQYTCENNDSIKARYFTSTEVLSELVGLEIGNKRGFISYHVAMNDLFPSNADYESENGMFEYSKKAAELIGVDLTGLVPSSISLVSGLGLHNMYDSYCEYYTNVESSKYSNTVSAEKISNRCVVWSKVYENGVIAPVFYVQYCISGTQKGLQRIQLIPQIPDKVFSIDDDNLLRLLYDTQYAEKLSGMSFDEWMPRINVIDKRYEVVCNNIISLVVRYEQTSIKTEKAELKTVRIFPDGVAYPKIPKNMVIPYTSLFPYGEFYGIDSYLDQNQ